MNKLLTYAALSLVYALILPRLIVAEVSSETDPSHTCITDDNSFLPTKMKAVVVGGTGAIGREVVSQLLVAGKWGEVVTVGRREVTLLDGYTDTSKHTGQLTQVVVDMDKLEEDPSAKSAMEGAHTVFCALGTTRGVAGSADAFVKVDYEYVAASARLAKSAGVSHFSVVTAQGSSTKAPAFKSALLQGLLYINTKGRAEEAVRNCGFDRVSIFRPGMLDRGDMLRPMEKFALKLMSSIKVSDVAKIMILDAERTDPQPLGIFSMANMKKAAAANVAPVYEKIN